MGRLKDSMEQISSQQEERHAQLMQAVTTDLQSFVHRKKSEINLLYQDNVNTKSKDLSDKLNRWIRYRKEKIYEEFRKPKTEGEIRTFLQTKLKPLLEEKKKEILQNAGMMGNSPTKFSREICDMGEAYCRRFETEFKSEYQQLALLAHDLVKEVKVNVSLDESLMMNVQADIAIQKKVTANDNKDTRNFYGNIGAGAAAGAAIGSVIPIIGTTAGAVIGGIAGLVRWGKNSDDISKGNAFRNQVSGDVSTMVEQYFGSLKDSILDIFHQSVANCWVQIERVMVQYLTQYTNIVNEMRKRDQKAQEEVALKIQTIQNDIGLTEQQMKQIQSVRSHLSQL